MPEVKQRRRPQRGSEISWETAFDRARRVASVLRERGVLPGERFHVHLTSSAGECRFGVVCEHVRDRAAHDRNGRGASAGAECRRITALALKASVTEVLARERRDCTTDRSCPRWLTASESMDRRCGGPTTSTRRRQLRTRPATPATRGDHRFAGFPAGPCPCLTALRRRWQPAHDSYRDPGGARSSVCEPGSRDLATRRPSRASGALRGWGAYTIP
jgi:hypothetical protein